MIKEIPLYTASSCLLILSLSGEHSFIQIKQKTQNNFYADTTRQINHSLVPIPISGSPLAGVDPVA